MVNRSVAGGLLALALSAQGYACDVPGFYKGDAVLQAIAREDVQSGYLGRGRDAKVANLALEFLLREHGELFNHWNRYHHDKDFDDAVDQIARDATQVHEHLAAAYAYSWRLRQREARNKGRENTQAMLTGIVGVLLP